MYHEVLDFWYDELTYEQKWRVDPEVDEAIRARFGRLHTQASKGELFSWRREHLGRLAEIIILDQFSRNIFRNDGRAYACDDMALTLTFEAVGLGVHKGLTKEKRHFLYMPFMHSESILIQQEGIKYFDDLEDVAISTYYQKHMRIIERFGRYPYRNKDLGRRSTDEEMAFLKEEGQGF